jgi:hypothetical protein
MNLQAITAGAVGAVNPMLACSVQLSTGQGVGADYSQTPQYGPAFTLQGQVQALTYRDLQQTEGLNMQGTRRAIYFQGDVEGIIRAKQLGGSLVTFPNGDVYLVAQVLENWGMDGGTSYPDFPGWCKVIATLQNDS